MLRFTRARQKPQKDVQTYDIFLAITDFEWIINLNVIYGRKITF